MIPESQHDLPASEIKGNLLSRPHDVFRDESVFIAGCSTDAGDVQPGKLNIIFHGIRIQLYDLCFYGVSFKDTFKCILHAFPSACHNIRELQQACAAVNEGAFLCKEGSNLISFAGIQSGNIILKNFADIAVR